MITAENFVQWYRQIRQANAGALSAPHKPLTLLFALSKVLRDEPYIDYKTERTRLEDYIWAFTNKATPPNSLQPLARLVNDSKVFPYWELLPANLARNTAGDIPTGAALKAGLKAGFSPDVYRWLRKNPVLVYEFILGIMRDNFPETLWPEVLDGLEIDPAKLSIPPKQEWFPVTSRDPAFPRQVLAAYDYRCCVCGLKIYLNEKPFPMEAAHIRWKARGGECVIENGLSLCPTHHYSFDKGLWTLSEKARVVLSGNLRVDAKRDQFFKPFAGHDITESLLDPKLAPAEKNLHWHRRTIFSA